MNRSEQLRRKIDEHPESRLSHAEFIHPHSQIVYHALKAELRGREDAFKEVREWLLSESDGKHTRFFKMFDERFLSPKSLVDDQTSSFVKKVDSSESPNERFK